MVDKENVSGPDVREGRIYRGRIRAGTIIMAIGLALTAGAYVLAPGNGYVVGWGVVFLGALFFLLGLSDWLLRRRIGLFTKGKATKAPQQLPVSESAEISKEDVRRAELELRRLGGRHNGKNFVRWIVVTERLDGARKASDWSTMKALYGEMARLLFEDGKHHIDAATAAQTSELRTYVPFGVNEVEIATSADSCRQCKSLQGERLRVADAIEQMPLPVKNCTNQARQKGVSGWCRCSYHAVLED